MPPWTCRDASPDALSSARFVLPMLHRRMRSIAWLSLLLVCAAGCGRPATRAECDEIVARIAELELRARGLTGDNTDEVKATKDALEKTTLRDCVGRRISDKAMGCVRSAKSTQQIVNECF